MLSFWFSTQPQHKALPASQTWNGLPPSISLLSSVYQIKQTAHLYFKGFPGQFCLVFYHPFSSGKWAPASLAPTSPPTQGSHTAIVPLCPSAQGLLQFLSSQPHCHQADTSTSHSGCVLSQHGVEGGDTHELQQTHVLQAQLHPSAARLNPCAGGTEGPGCLKRSSLHHHIPSPAVLAF